MDNAGRLTVVKDEKKERIVLTAEIRRILSFGLFEGMIWVGKYPDNNSLLFHELCFASLAPFTGLMLHLYISCEHLR